MVSESKRIKIYEGLLMIFLHQPLCMIFSFSNSSASPSCRICSLILAPIHILWLNKFPHLEQRIIGLSATHWSFACSLQGLWQSECMTVLWRANTSNHCRQGTEKDTSTQVLFVCMAFLSLSYPSLWFTHCLPRSLTSSASYSDSFSRIS